MHIWYGMRTESATVTGDIMTRTHSLVSKSALLTALHCETLLATLDTDAWREWPCCSDCACAGVRRGGVRLERDLPSFSSFLSRDNHSGNHLLFN